MQRIRSIPPLFALVAAGGCATVPAPAARDHGAHAAPAPHRGHVVKLSEIDAHLRFLSSGLLEGRAPATRGGRLAAGFRALRPGRE